MATQKVRPDPGALERQSRNQRRRSTRQRAGGYALLAILVIAAAVVGVTTLTQRETRPADRGVEENAPTTRAEGSAPTVEELQGIWYEDRGEGEYPEPMMFWFAPDGTFTWGGVLDTDSWTTANYEIAGHRITFTDVGGSCGGGFTFSWDVGIVAEGRIEAVHQGSSHDDPTVMGGCYLPVGERYGLTRVSPTSPAAEDLSPGYYVGGAITADVAPIDLEGMWLVEGTGHLLRIDFGGGYRLDDDGELASTPRDTGTIEAGRGSLTFTSSAGANGCSEGDVMVWEKLRVRGGALHGEVAQDTCDRGIGPQITVLFLDLFTP